MTRDEWKLGIYDGVPQQKISYEKYDPRTGKTTVSTCEDCFFYREELQLRELAFGSCVNLIARAIANCEFKTFEGRKETKNDYYYTLNVEPNLNENSTAFWQKVTFRLYANNEVLIVPLQKNRRIILVVADSWTPPEDFPTKERVYENIQIGDESFTRKLKESEVLHLTLSNKNVKQVVDAIYNSYSKLLQTAMKSSAWNNGQHMKVHVGQIASGKPNFEQEFAAMLESKYKPFLSSTSGILPEFDGYDFQPFGGNTTAKDTRDIRALVDDIFTFTARGFGIPPVLLLGDVAGLSDAISLWLTTVVDPLAAQIGEECNRKFFGLDGWMQGWRVLVDTSTIQHFDMFANAANVEKIVGSAVWSINDILVKCGQEPLPYDWADKHWMTKNIATIEEVVREAASQKKEGQNA